MSTLESLVAHLGTATHEQMALAADPSAAAVAKLRAHHDLPELLSLKAGSETEEGAIRRAIRASAAAVGEAACIDPSNSLVARLGSRPPGGLARAIWDRTVAAHAIAVATHNLEHAQLARAQELHLPDIEVASRALRAAEMTHRAPLVDTDLTIEWAR